ncbi:MAG: MFS transporter [Acidobacteria bacterium]|nr:MFS transporter [Acidobacteriota bacterium]
MSGDVVNERVPRIAILGLATSMLGMTALPFAVTGTNLGVPLIKADFNASLSTLSWTLSGYSIVLAALTMLGGTLAARTGTLRAFQIGTIIFAASSALCVFAPNAAILVAGRVLQGVGGAFIVPASVSVALVGWPDSRRAFAMGVWTGAFPIGSTTAPIICSAVITGGEWRWIFVVPLGLALLTFGLSLVLRAAGKNQPIAAPAAPGLPDIVGMIAGTAATGLTALGLVQGKAWGWSSVRTIGVFVIGAILVPVLIARSRSHPRPFLPVRMFSVPTFRVANIANVAVSMIGMSVWLIWPLLLGGLWKYDAWGIGLAMSPTPVLGGLGAIFSSRLVERFGYRTLLSAGAVALVAATLWFMLRTEERADYWGHLFPGLILTGIGMGLLFSFLNAAALSDLEPLDFPTGNATFSTGRFLSGAIGIAAVVAMMSSGGDHPVDPFRRAYGFLFAMSIVAFVAIVVLWPRKRS